MLLIIFKKYVIFKLAGVKQNPTFCEVFLKFLFSDLEIMKKQKVFFYKYVVQNAIQKLRLLKNDHLPNVWPHFEHYL
jgi:hypothetical protein